MNSKKSKKFTETILCYKGPRKNNIGPSAYPIKLE